MLYDYTNKEKDIVTLAFRTGNCTSLQFHPLVKYLRDLPNSLNPSRVTETVQSRINGNLSSKTKESAVQRSVRVPGRDHLKEFEWVPDPYYLAEESKRVEAKDKKAKCVSSLPFAPPPAGKKGSFSVNHFSAEKYENLSGGTDTRLVHFDDPYDAAKDKGMRDMWLERMKVLYGEFRPAPQERNLEKVGRSLLPDIVLQLRKCLTTDWPECKMIVGCMLVCDVTYSESEGLHRD